MSKASKRRHHQQVAKQRARLNKSTPHANKVRATNNSIRKILAVAPLLLLAAVLVYAVAVLGKRKNEAAAVSNSATSTQAIPVALTFTQASSATVATSNSGPKIQFAKPEHDFGKITCGEVGKHAYIFTNVGDRVLEITDVKPGCGCTTAGEWSRKVEPGQTGSIPIQFNSANFSGQVGKSITVTCNDAAQPTVMLQLKANIWKPIDVAPQFAMLNVTPESPSNETVVRIVNNLEEPLTLSPPQVGNPAFAAELVTNQPGKEFQLKIRTLPPLPAGNVQGPITVKTSSTNMPVISITAWANVQQTVMVTPSQITLPATPTQNPLPYTLSIRNNGTNTISLSDPLVTVQGVDVQLKEIMPGRVFTAILTFPPAVEITPGKPMEFTVKSSHLQYPVLKVPILRLAPTPAPSPIPPGPSTGPR